MPIMLRFLILLSLLVPQMAWGTAKIIPHQDLAYVGSFRPPTDQDNNKYYGQDNPVLGYNHVTGKLLAGGKSYQNPALLHQLTIPANLSTSRVLVDIPRATEYQTWFDPTGGKGVGGYQGYDPALGPAFSDILFMTAQGEQATDKLYWVASLAYDQTGFNVGSLGWCEPDGSNSQGAWKLDGDGYYSKVWAHYALEINNTWAAANTSGKTLGVGKIMNNGSRGPSLFATAPWLDNNGAPLADQGVMAHKTLMYFPFEHPINIWSGASNVTGNDGAWITIGDKQAFVVLWGVTYASEMGYWWKSITPSTSVTYDARCGEFVSTSAMTTDSMTVSVNDASNWPTRGTMRIGSEYMKYSSRTGSTLSISERGVQGSTIEAHNSGSYAQLYTQDSVDYTGSIQESNGNIGLVKFPILLFFDVDQLAEVAAGTRQSYDMAPYAMLNLNDFFHESEARNNGGYRPATTYGMAYDPVENRLIISERLYTLGWEPLYHVVELNDVGTTLDTATPSAPTGVSVNGSGVISWSGDANGDYVIFKYYPQGICTADTVEYRPIASIRGTSWTDPLYQVGDLYAVRAMSDAMIQSGYAYSSIRNAEIKSSGTISSFGASGTAVSIRQ